MIITGDIKYRNGNVDVTIKEDGTKVREWEGEPLVIHPETIDVKITNYCDAGCPFCFPSGTKILMSDYTQKNIEDIKIGDEVIGFDEYPDKTRKIHKTIVTNLYSRKSELIEILTSDGRVITTPNHPFLTHGHGKNLKEYDYKRASSLKIGDSIYRIPFYPNDIKISSNYKKGYILACFIGDGTFKHYIDKHGYDAYNVRFVVKDQEITDRLMLYLKEFTSDFYQSPFKIGNLIVNSCRSNKKSSYDYVLALKHEIMGKLNDPDYCAGFLAGFYDCEGSINRVIRICNCDKSIIDEGARCLNVLGIDYAVEIDKSGTKNYDIKYNIRIKRRREWIKFLQYTKSACIRKGLLNVFEKQLMYSEIVTATKLLDESVMVYNFSTGTHTYYADTFAVHNCHESSTMSGVHGNLDKLAENLILLPAGVELAIGGGNPLSHPDLEKFLFFCQDEFIVNMTVNQVHLKPYYDKLKHLFDMGLVNALGISVTNTNLLENQIERISKLTPNIVFHVIAGVHEPKIIDELAKYGYPILVLGYKSWGFGLTYKIGTSRSDNQISEKVKVWKREIPKYLGKVHLCFDNLAVEQLELKKWFTDEKWNEIFLGEDFTISMYIDAVKQEYSPTSRNPLRVSSEKISLEKFFKQRNNIRI